MKRRIKPILAIMIPSQEFAHEDPLWKCNLCGLYCVSKSGMGRHLSITHQVDYEWREKRVVRVLEKAS